MKRITICLVAISVAGLLFAGRAFSEKGPSGASGMLNARELREVSKSGGTVTSQSNVLNGGIQVRYGGDEKSRSAPITNASTINQLNKKGFAAGPGGSVILSGQTVSGIVSKAISSSRGSINSAVNALQGRANAIAQHFNLPVASPATNSISDLLANRQKLGYTGGPNDKAYGSTVIPPDKDAKMDAWAVKLGLAPTGPAAAGPSVPVNNNVAAKGVTGVSGNGSIPRVFNTGNGSVLTSQRSLSDYLKSNH